ncbi:MAG: phage tail protein [Pseudomonas lundensis]|uniref:phage tail tape measure protein n=1 Tax=Pseudomonas lundensis TaxID=86185 RepID=UPI0019C33764|nr:phage tail tape measure protein [Pseudomonas lundensis]NLT99535.1 phage tail protein [Pseudomonas lundensis]
MANDLRLRVLLTAIDKATAPLRSIQGQSAKAAQALKAARDSLKGLGAAQKQVGEFRQLKQGLANTSAELVAARNKARELGRQMASTTTPTRAMQREFDKARRSLQQLKQQEISQNQQLNQLRQRLKATGVDTRNLSEHERRLKQQMADANRQIDTQRKRLEALTKQQQRMTRAGKAYQQGQQLAGNSAAKGAASMGVAYGIGRGLYAPLKEGKHFALEEQRVAALGLGKEDTSKAINFAKKMKTYGTSVTENLTLVRDAMTVFADEHEAEMVAPTLAKMKFANHALFGEEQGADNERKFMDMLKVIEMRGGLASKEAFINQADIVQRILTATGGRVGPNEWLNVIKTGGVAAKGIKDEAFYYQMEPLVQEMGGHRVGTAMMSAYSNIYQGKTTKRAANNMEQLGLVDPKKVKHDKAGQIAFLDVGAIKGSELFRENQFEWMEKILLPQLAAKGITDKNKVLDTIGSIFSNRTASNLFAQMYLQRHQIHKNARLNEGADGIDQLYVKAVDSTQGNELELLAQKANAYREMSDAILPTYVAALKQITVAIKELTAWMKENPAAAAAVLKTVMVVGVMAATFGALALTLASLIGPFVVLRYGMTMFGIKSGGIFKVIRNLFPTITGLARNALPMLAQGLRVLVSLMGGALITALRSVGIALWALAANPIVLAIGVIIALLAGAAYLIYKNWDAVKGYFDSSWKEIKAGFDGGIGGILTVLANFSPIGLIYQAFAGVLSYLGIDLPNRFTEFGSMIVSGLVNGLYAGLGKIKDAINNIGDSTIGWFKEKLDIHSPSRVFAQLGSFTMAGLTQGLIEGGKGPLNAISQLGKQLAATGVLALGTLSPPALAVDMRPPITPPAPTTYDSNDRYEINIHPTPNMDAQAIARAVRAELSRIKSEKAVRMRSKLGDLE